MEEGRAASHEKARLFLGLHPEYEETLRLVVVCIMLSSVSNQVRAVETYSMVLLQIGRIT